MVRVRERRVRQEPSPKTRKMTRLTETGSRATGTGSSATDDVTDDVSNLFSFRHIYPTDVIGLQSLAAYCSTVAAKRRILFIASGKLLQLYLQRNGTEIQFLQNLHSICRQSVLQVGA